MDSILNSTKKVLGIPEDYAAFDPDIIMYINSAMSIVSQIGVGSDAGVFIEDETATWTDLPVPATQLNMVKTYVQMRCRLGFDPPGTSFYLEALTKQITEYEVRLNIMREETQWTDPAA